ncbi:hypothetical protein BVG16_18430 [Paenibacillus selenitireducens]|uniref:RNA polymerase n=1 Tax=Paenibacillus selenitireducens TaxID=1324314 RepID=A0A1T2X8N6_9BACL|nr:RNA polymerase sigma factor SigJ [Paenibacillus selenitireducens]OPA76185.1 hypothetical protein BVG16_18430 [Paenibacillus selenitireducens]
MDLDQLYTTYQPMLQSIAYRMLGSISESEDVVHDVFLEFVQSQREHVQNEKGYLIRSVTNRCINLLKSARKRRELYVGPWLPEPQVTDIHQTPDQLLEMRESVSYALLVLMEQLSPLERAVFILKDTLGYSHEDIADILQKTTVSCRKIYSRTKQKLQPELTHAEEQAELAEQLSASFIAATQSGDFLSFIEHITENAVLLTDGGGRVRAAINPIYGKARILAFLEGIYAKGSYAGTKKLISVNGQQGAWIVTKDQILTIVCFQFDPQLHKAQHIYFMKNPDKLTHVLQSQV